MPKDTSHQSLSSLSASSAAKAPYPIGDATTDAASALDRANVDSKSSAATKARLMFKRQLSQARDDKASHSSSPRDTVAEGTPRLFVGLVSLQEGSGRASNGRFTVADGKIVLDDAASDGNPRNVPSDAQRARKITDRTLDQYVQLQEGDPVLQRWLEVLGRAVIYHMFPELSQGVRKVKVDYLLQLPHGYTLWHHDRGPVSSKEDRRKDKYLYGCITNGVFRSPAEFFPHLIWLMTGERCTCQYCSDNSQEELSAQFFGKVSGKGHNHRAHDSIHAKDLTFK